MYIQYEKQIFRSTHTKKFLQQITPNKAAHTNTLQKKRYGIFYNDAIVLIKIVEIQAWGATTGA